jgi:hypothetical protein
MLEYKVHKSSRPYIKFPMFLHTSSVAHSIYIIYSACFIAGGMAQVREDIEASNRDARWEFNRGVLFERTGAMADVCGDLADMVETLDSYHQFLGPELKSVTGDPQVS